MPTVNKAIIYNGPEDVYGSCGCGMNMAIIPVLVPKDWYVEDCPSEVSDDEFCKGDDFRRVMGFSANNVFEHEIGDVVYLANFSCCRECAERAVALGYAVWSSKEYPMALR